MDAYRSVSPDLAEDLEVHAGEADEGQDAGGEGRVPDLKDIQGHMRS